MRVLIIGGTGLTGSHLVRELDELGHQVTVFHRGRTALRLPRGAHEILGDKNDLASHQESFARLGLDVAVNMLSFTRSDAEQFVETFRGIINRAVVVSSIDVYLAYGRLHGTERGSWEAVPLTEESPLRQKLGLGGELYDKIGVEAAAREAPELPATIIRYPAVYGPGDQQHRFYYHIKRMADQRPAILLRESEAAFHWPHVYAENAAHAVVLAATRALATGRTYNVAEAEIPNWHERLQQLARVMGWQGRVVVIPDDTLPEELVPESFLRSVANFQRMPDYQQDYLMDSSRIRAELGYCEILSVDEGLRKTIAWISDSPPSTTPPHRFDYEAEDRLLESLT